VELPHSTMRGAVVSDDADADADGADGPDGAIATTSARAPSARDASSAVRIADDARQSEEDASYIVATYLRALGAPFSRVSAEFERQAVREGLFRRRVDVFGNEHDATYEELRDFAFAGVPDDAVTRATRAARRNAGGGFAFDSHGEIGKVCNAPPGGMIARIRAREIHGSVKRTGELAHSLTDASTVPQKMNCLRTLRAHRDAAYCAVLSKSGARLVTGGDDRLVKIWCAYNGLLRVACRGHVGEITYVAIDAREEIVASASTDTSVRTWKLDSGAPVAVLLGHTRSITELHFCPKAPHVLLSTADDGTIRLWNALRSSNVVKPLVIDMTRQGAIEGGRVVESNDDDVPLATAMQDGVAEGQMRTRGDQLNSVASANAGGNQEECQVICGAFNGSGTKFAVGTTFCKMHAWSLDLDAFDEDASPPAEAVKSMSSSAKHLNDIASIFFSHSGDRILTSSKDGQARIWEVDATGRRFVCANVLTTPTEAEALRAQLMGATAVNPRRAPTVPAMHVAVWSTDDKYVIASMGDNSIRVFDAFAGKLVHSMHGHTASTYVLQSNPLDSRLAMSASYDGKIIIWDIINGVDVRIFDGSHYNTQLVDGNWHPDGTSIIVSDLSGQFSIFGTGDSSRLLRAKYEQFLQTEFAEEDLLGRSEGGHLIDLATGALLNDAFPRNLLCDAMGDPYPDPYQSAYQSGQLAAIGANFMLATAPVAAQGIAALAPVDVEGPWSAPEMGPEPILYRMSDDEDDDEDAGAVDDDEDDEDVQIDEDEEDDDDYDSDFERRSRRRRNRASRARRRTRRGRFDSDFSDSDASEDRATRRSARESRMPQRLGVDAYDTSEDDDDDDGQPRITRRRRRELDDLKLLSNDDTDEEEEEERPKKRAKAPVVSRADMRLHDAYKWLCSPEVTVGTYVPQLGDDVVYVAQGHYEYLQDAGRNWRDEAPWQSLTSMRFVEPCRVTSLRYVIADDGTFDTHCLITLKLMDESIADAGKDFFVRLHRSESPDFLVPLSRYSTAEACKWKRGDNCAALWDNTGCGDMEPWYGMIETARKHEGKWAGSPWNALSVQYFNVQNEEDRFMDHSFWELYADDVMKKEHAKVMSGASSSRAPRRAKFSAVDENTPRLSAAVQKELLGRVQRAANHQRFEAFVDVIGPNETFIRSREGVSANYCSVVPVPMGLSLIQERLRNSYYRQIDAFKSDVELVRINCEIFHGESSDYTAVATDLEDDLLNEIPERDDTELVSSVASAMKSYPAIVCEQPPPPAGTAENGRVSLRVRMRRG